MRFMCDTDPKEDLFAWFETGANLSCLANNSSFATTLSHKAILFLSEQGIESINCQDEFLSCCIDSWYFIDIFPFFNWLTHWMIAFA
jgi:hypothetical protein